MWWARCEMPHAACILPMLWFSCESCSQETSLLDYGCMPWIVTARLKPLFRFFTWIQHQKRWPSIIKSSSHPINNWSSKGVSNQDLDLIWYPRHYIKRLRNNLFSFCVSHILSASMHSGIPLKTKKPYVNFQAYDPPLGFFFFFLLCLRLSF